MKGLSAALGLVLVGAGCSLDPFFYTRETYAAYQLPAEGTSPEETVAASRIEPLSIRVDDQVTLGAAYVRAAISPPRGYLIFFHGRSDALDKQFGRAKRLSNLGYDVLAFDYRGFGISTDVAPTEAGVADDTRAVLATMRQRAGSATPLIYYGHSFGTAAATQRAQLDAPAALILESTFGSIEEFKTDSTQLDFPATFVMKDTWATSTRIKDIHAPLLMLHGLADDFVRPEFSKAVFANANEPKQLVLVDGAGHGDVPEKLGAAFTTTVNGFIQAHVR